MNRLIPLVFALVTSACFSHLDLPGVGSSDYASSRDLLEAQRINALKEAKNGGMSSDCKGPSDCRQLAINGLYGYGAGGMMPIGSVYPAQAMMNGLYNPPVVLPPQQQVVLVNGGSGGLSPADEQRLRIVEKRTDGLLQAVSMGEAEEPKAKAEAKK